MGDFNEQKIKISKYNFGITFPIEPIINWHHYNLDFFSLKRALKRALTQEGGKYIHF